MGKGLDNHKLPTRYVRVGDVVERYGRTLVCTRRPDNLMVDRACSGCWFSRGRKSDGTMINCNDIQCSKWDRMDGANVWFKEVSPLDVL